MLLLELVVRSEQKIAKVIALIEESRRDNPFPTETTPAPKLCLSRPIRVLFSTRSNRRGRRLNDGVNEGFLSAQLARRRSRPHLHG